MYATKIHPHWYETFNAQMKDTGTTFNIYLSDHLIHRWTAGGTTVRKEKWIWKNAAAWERVNFQLFHTEEKRTQQILTANTPPPHLYSTPHPSCTSACCNARCCTNSPATAAPPHRGSAESCGPPRGRSPWRGWRTAGSLCYKTGNPCRGKQTQ